MSLFPHLSKHSRFIRGNPNTPAFKPIKTMALYILFNFATMEGYLSR